VVSNRGKKVGVANNKRTEAGNGMDETCGCGGSSMPAEPH